MTATESRQVSWHSVFVFSQRCGIVPDAKSLSGLPVAGTPAWDQLSDDDPQKLAAVVLLGVQFALQLDARQEALAAASRSVAAAEDWPRLASDIRGRQQFHHEHPWSRRVVA